MITFGKGTIRAAKAASSRRGLTAVELLVAAALSSLLMVSVLGLLGTMHVHCRELVAGTQVEPWESLLAAQLRRDLGNARFITAEPDRIVLTGYLGTRGAGLSVTHRAAEVTYHVVRVDQSWYLLRDERPLVVASNTRSSRHLVAADVRGLRFERPGSSQPGGDYAGSIPAVCRIRVLGGPSTTPIAEVVYSQ